MAEKPHYITTRIDEGLGLDGLAQKAAQARKGHHGISPVPLTDELLATYRDVVSTVRSRAQNIGWHGNDTLVAQALRAISVPHARKPLWTENFAEYNPQLYHAAGIRSLRADIANARGGSNRHGAEVAAIQRIVRATDVLTPDETENGRLLAVQRLVGQVGLVLELEPEPYNGAERIARVGNELITLTLTPNDPRLAWQPVNGSLQFAP